MKKNRFFGRVVMHNRNWRPVNHSLLSH